MPEATEEHLIVRPAQLCRGPLRAGIVAMGDGGDVLLQVHVGQELPIRRIALAVGDTSDVDGWTLTLRGVDRSGRGSVTVEVTPPGDDGGHP